VVAAGLKKFTPAETLPHTLVDLFLEAPPRSVYSQIFT
jgi:hypothetical protein